MRWIPSLRSDTEGLENEEGSEVVSYVLVQGLVLFLVLALLQFAFALHTRNMVIAAASEGARRGALLDGLVGARHYEVSTSREALGGRSVLVVTVKADLPLLVNLGPSWLRASGSALVEEE